MVVYILKFLSSATTRTTKISSNWKKIFDNGMSDIADTIKLQHSALIWCGGKSVVEPHSIQFNSSFPNGEARMIGVGHWYFPWQWVCSLASAEED